MATDGTRSHDRRRTTAHLRVNAARVLGAGNAVAAVNAVLAEADKDEVRYRNGVTLPIAAKRLLADARRRNARHSDTLARNLAAAKVERPAGVAAHHIVAHGDARAFPSRELLFGWGIAINDVDNGVYLPRNRRSHVPSLPHAVKHSTLHTGLYHLEVYARLVDVAIGHEHAQAGRDSLRGIKAELVDGTFPFRPEGKP